MSVRGMYRNVIKAMLERKIAAGGCMMYPSGRGGLRVGGVGVGGKMKSKSKSKSKPKKKSKSGGANPWLAHLKKVKRQNPRMSLKEAMMKARRSY